MGLDMRIIPDDRVDCIVQDLRTHGFDVDVRERTITLTPERCRQIGIAYPHEPYTTRLIECWRGDHKIVLSVSVDGKQFPGYRIYIPNLGSWWPSRNRELVALQSDVTQILEANGAYWPFDEDGG
jgi:hypothetical protein